MREIGLKAGNGSRILILGGLLDGFADEVRPASQAFVVTDDNVGQLYLEKVVTALQEKNFATATCVFPAGERTKSHTSLLVLYERFLEQKLDRGSIVLALGGGVIGDLAGFAAATYMRGTRFVQMPTSLLAQVDAAIGGKVAVNHLGLKNLIGTFFQPETVIVDPETLATLPERELRCGFAEVIKAGIIGDVQLFEMLENTKDFASLVGSEPLEDIISRSVAVKVRVVEQDECEAGIRRVLNFGHTIGHALEESDAFKNLSHGEAVATGMVLEARLSSRLNLASPALAEKIERLITGCGFEVSLRGASPGSLGQLMLSDKKTRAGKLVFALPVEPGKVIIVEDVKHGLVHEVLMEAAS